MSEPEHVASIIERMFFEQPEDRPMTWHATLTCHLCKNVIRGPYTKCGGGFLARYRCLVCKPYKPK